MFGIKKDGKLLLDNTGILQRTPKKQTLPKTALFLTLLIMTSPVQAETVVNGRPSVVLEGKIARLIVDIGGGSIVDFQLSAQGINPLVFDNIVFEPKEKFFRPMAHFLCLDRWGAPSKAEKQNGMFFHGEASRVEWKILKRPTLKGKLIKASMSASLPLAGLEVKRLVQLSDTSATFTISETVINRNKLGRIYNMVQHPTIGPPFLDETTLVDSNARKGFMQPQSDPQPQPTSLPTPEEPAVYWPHAVKKKEPVNLRQLTSDADPNVVSFIFEENLGWVTASNASQGLLIGYLWKTSEYPWLNIWRHVEKGKPFARGLEFGTTGLHAPFSILVEKGKIFDRPLYVHLDTGQSVVRSYRAFLFEIPNDYQGVGRLTYTDGTLIIHERGRGADRDLSMAIRDLFP